MAKRKCRSSWRSWKSQRGDDRDQPGNAIRNQECDDLRAFVSEQRKNNRYAGYENGGASDQSKTETITLIRLFIPHPLPLDEMRTNYPWTKKEDHGNCRWSRQLLFSTSGNSTILKTLVIAPCTKGSFSTRGYHAIFSGSDAGSR